METQDILTAPEASTAMQLAADCSAYATNVVVADDTDFTARSNDLALIKSAQKRVEELRVSMTKPLLEAQRRINDFFRGPADKLVAAEHAIKKALVSFDTERRRQAAEAQARADEAARKERERLEREAAKLEVKGKTEQAETKRQLAETIVAPVVAPPPPAAPKGQAFRLVWKFQVLDPALVPDLYKTVDETKIRKVVGALKDQANIPGVKIWSERDMSSRAAS
jgi:hypothetical protein